MDVGTVVYDTRSLHASELCSSTIGTMSNDFSKKESPTLLNRLENIVSSFFKQWDGYGFSAKLPVRAFSPSSAYVNGYYSIMTPEALFAEKQYRNYGVLPSEASSTTALTLISYANQNSNAALRSIAFDALISSFEEQRDTLQDYCMAVWFVTQNLTPSFLSKEKIDALRAVQAQSIPNLRALQSLSKVEQQQLLDVLENRARNGDNGMGPVKFNDLVVYLGNFRSPGSTFRILTKDSQNLVLRVAHTNDLHQFIMYSQFLNNGTLIPPGVKNDPLYNVNIAKIEISSKLYAKLVMQKKILTNGLGIEAFLTEIQKKNPQTEISQGSTNFEIRSSKAKSECFYVMPTVLLVPNSDMYEKQTRTGQA